MCKENRIGALFLDLLGFKFWIFCEKLCILRFSRFLTILGVAPYMELFEILLLTWPKPQFNALAIIIELYKLRDAL